MLKQLFSDSDLDRWMEKFKEDTEAAIIEQLQAAGEIFVKLARESGTYDNHTNNLRSSIGYLIAKNNVGLSSNFQQAGNGTESDGSKGIAFGQKLAKEIAASTDGLVLIGVAGMNYAAYVEANGLEVISSSAIQTEMWLRKSIQEVASRSR